MVFVVLFVLFVFLQLCPILAYLKKNWSTDQAEKYMLLRKKIIRCTVWELLNPFKGTQILQIDWIYT